MSTNLTPQMEVFRDLVVCLAEGPISEANFLDGYCGAKEFLEVFARFKELGAIEVGDDGFLHFPGEQETDLRVPRTSAYRFQEVQPEFTEQELAEFRKRFDLGYSQTQIIKAIWGAKPGGTRDYKKALMKYRQLRDRM